ncbi:MAG: hypothetical protein M1830_006357, partial [Pleopsidium flavum]
MALTSQNLAEHNHQLGTKPNASSTLGQARSSRVREAAQDMGMDLSDAGFAPGVQNSDGLTPMESRKEESAGGISRRGWDE